MINISSRDCNFSNKKDLALYTEGFNLAEQASGEKPSSEREVLDWYNKYKKYQNKFWFLMNNSDEIGIVRIGEYKSDVHKRQAVGINVFAIFEKYQGQGLGLESIRYLIDYCLNAYKGYPITLGVAKTNTRAFNLYKKVGFTIIREYDDSYLMQLTEDYNERPSRKSNKIWTESLITSVNDLHAFYADSTYGLIERPSCRLHSETHNSTTQIDYDLLWRLATIDEQLKAKGGICYDTVYFSKYFLDKWGIENHVYFACTTRNLNDPKYDDPTHTFIVYRDKSKIWRWLEGSWGPYKNNTVSYRVLDKIVVEIRNRLDQAAKAGNTIFEIVDYPEPGTNMREFRMSMLKGIKRL